MGAGGVTGKATEIKIGSKTIRILKQGNGFAGIVVGQSSDRIEGTTALEVETRLRARIAEKHPDFVGIGGARARFLKLFSEGFADPVYLGDQTYGERNYKLAASDLLCSVLPLESLPNTLGAGEIALKVVQKTNLIDRFNKARLSDVLRGPRASEFLSIIRACRV